MQWEKNVFSPNFRYIINKQMKKTINLDLSNPYHIYSRSVFFGMSE